MDNFPILIQVLKKKGIKVMKNITSYGNFKYRGDFAVILYMEHGGNEAASSPWKYHVMSYICLH